MVCFIDTYWVRYTTEGVELLPPRTFDPYWVTAVYRWGDFYSCCYSNRYPAKGSRS